MNTSLFHLGCHLLPDQNQKKAIAAFKQERPGQTAGILDGIKNCTL
jgi:hypothetical protein